MILDCSEIFIPKEDIDYTKWAVVSCDQFSSNIEYWKSLKKEIGDAPSTLKLIIPEVYLKTDCEERNISKIHHTMELYCQTDIFRILKDTAVLVEREMCTGVKRYGIVSAIDLDEYSYKKTDKKQIRSTEAIVEERIAPRVAVRMQAPIELPHIIIFADDAKGVFIDSIVKDIEELEKLYDFEANKGGRRIRGFAVPKQVLVEKYREYEKHMNSIYPNENTRFLVGDGNHSLVTAKRCWDEIKKTLKESELKTHPARYALCEIENIHSIANKFEPIYRKIFNVKHAEFIDLFKKQLSILGNEKIQNTLKIVVGDTTYIINTGLSAIEMIGATDNVIEKYIQAHSESSVEYVHGEDELLQGLDDKTAAIYMPEFDKNELFPYCIENGNLPKKSFSIGNGEEKRYYIEAKRITK